MRKSDYDYTIYKENSSDIFIKACKKVENNFPKAKKQKLLIDVDGSTIQTYTIEDKDIDIYDDYDVGAVYVLSDVDLGELFN